MNIRHLSAFLCLIAAGCVTHGHSQQPGNITFVWSFAGGQTCNDQPDVQSVRITIDGEVLQNNGIFPCLTNGQPSIVLANFAPGDYTFTVDALSTTGEVFFTQGGTFTVDGDITVSVDLEPLPNTGGASVAWQLVSGGVTFSCGQAGISTVNVEFRNVATGVDFFGNGGIAVPCTDYVFVYDLLPPAAYAVFIQGVDNTSVLWGDITSPPQVVVQPGVFPSANQALLVDVSPGR